MGPCEGRPPGPVWAHQRFDEFFPGGLRSRRRRRRRHDQLRYDPQVASSLNSGIDPSHGLPLRFHPKLPIQNPNSVWTFNGTIPPKLVQGRYGEPLLFRHHNGLPADVTQNGGFGRHTISTHEHNGHHGAENDGFTGAFFFPNQYYDYHWPIVLAGHFTHEHRRRPIAMASTPDDSGGADQRPGRLARDDEHALVPRPHVQLHGAERLQGQRRDVQHLQRPRSRQRGHRRRRQPAAAERRVGARPGATSITTST